MRGLQLDERELVLTSVLDAHPDVREPSVPPTIWPLLAALAVGAMFLTSIFTPWAVLVGAIPIAIALTAWFWPKSKAEEEAEQ
jgi:cytochrome c oxidase subunit I+III